MNSASSSSQKISRTRRHVRSTGTMRLVAARFTGTDASSAGCRIHACQRWHTLHSSAAALWAFSEPLASTRIDGVRALQPPHQRDSGAAASAWAADGFASLDSLEAAVLGFMLGFSGAWVLGARWLPRMPYSAA